MNKSAFALLPMPERAELAKRAGTLVEVDDYYSYQVFRYMLDGEEIDVTRDYMDHVISVEFSRSSSHLRLPKTE